MDINDDLLERFMQLVRSVDGCTDGACIIRRPKGLHTNGGCKCARDYIKAQRVMQAAQLIRMHIEEQSK